MKLTVVVPAYNEEKYLRDCIESVLADCQNLEKNRGVEIVVVNNASTDGTEKIALAYNDQIKLVNEPNKGLTKARQAGYLASTGDLIANIDADNRLPVGWLNKVFSEFEKDNKLVGLSGPLHFYDLSTFINLQVMTWYYLGYITYLINHYILHTSGMMQGGNFIVRRTALEKINGYDISIEFYGEDTDIARRLRKVGKIKFTFNLKMFSSGRRLAKEGVVSSGVKYAINYFWVLFTKKPFHKQHVDVGNLDKK